MQSKIAELLHQYFELGVAEGREGRNHDTEAGDAQRVLSEIEAEIAALSAAEPVCCGKPVHEGSPEAYTLECCGKFVQSAPSVAVKATPVEWQLVYDDGNVSRSVYTKEEAEEYERRSASVISIRPLYAATTHQSTYESSLRLEFEKLLDACIREFGWAPDAKPDEPVGNDPECEITWGDLHRAHSALTAQVQDVAGWQSMDTAPKDGSEFAAGRRYSPDGEFVVHTYRWVGPPNYWLSKRNGVCIRPSYQADYKWCPLPAAPAKQES